MALAVSPVLLNVTVELAVKCVNWPVITTLDTIWPCCPLAVLSERTTGVPAVTVNLPLPVAISLPVVTVTLLAPVAAPAAIVRVAVRWVASVNVMALAVTPVLLNVTVELAVKCVNCPVITTLDSTWPCCPLAVLSERTTGVPAVTVNKLLPVAISLPVVTVTLLAPVAAPAERDRGARREVRELPRDHHVGQYLALLSAGGAERKDHRSARGQQGQV